jgi:hypothetical protein
VAAKERRHFIPRGWLGGAGVRARLVSGRFTALTSVLLVLMLAMPFVEHAAVRELVGDVGFSALLLFATLSVGHPKRTIALFLAALPFVARWVRHFGFEVVPPSLLIGADLVFLLFITGVVLHVVFQDEAVSADTIVGAVCAYLLFAFTFAYAFALTELLSPGAFLFSAPLVAPEPGATTGDVRQLMMYFSFVTLSTAGSNLISAVNGPARALSGFESLFGQLYLTVLLARLVGISTSRPRDT